MLLFINVVFLENEPLSCLEWLSEPRTTTEQQQIVKIEYFTITCAGVILVEGEHSGVTEIVSKIWRRMNEISKGLFEII